MNFTKTKNGYSAQEVDDYISLTESEHAQIVSEKDEIIKELKENFNAIKEKEMSITLALTAAIDKAKEIETSSRNIYRLKIEQMTILCSKWEMLLNEMIRKYPGIEDVSNVREDINGLKNVIKNALKDDFNIDLISKNPVTDPIRVLLSRLGRNNCSKKSESKPISITRSVKVSVNNKTEVSKLEEKVMQSNQIKPIVNLNLKKDDKYENLVDKFLNNDDEELSQNTIKRVLKVPEKRELNTFDLNEAINPTEDLEEIMKAFDFYKKSSGQ